MGMGEPLMNYNNVLNSIENNFKIGLGMPKKNSYFDFRNSKMIKKIADQSKI